MFFKIGDLKILRSQISQISQENICVGVSI